MIRIIHIGDVHLGAKFEGLGDKGVLQRRQIEKSFERSVQAAIDKEANLFLIAGDLFDSDNPPQSVVDFVRRQIEKLSKSAVKTVIIPGNHDFLSDKSVYKKNFWSDLQNTFVFNDPLGDKKYFSDLDLTIYAKVLTTKNSTESAVLKTEPSNTKYHIMMAHGSFIASERAREMFFDQCPITADDIKNSKMNYIALGNFHGAQEVSQAGVPAWYSGSPEALAFDQKNAGSALYVEIDGKGTRVEAIKVGERMFDQKEIILDNVVDSAELKNKILEGASDNLARKVILSGFSRPDIFIDEESLEAELGSQFFKLIIADKSAPQLSIIDETKYPQELIIGQFVALAKEKIETAKSDIEKEVFQKALQLGLSELEK